MIWRVAALRSSVYITCESSTRSLVDYMHPFIFAMENACCIHRRRMKFQCVGALAATDIEREKERKHSSLEID